MNIVKVTCTQKWDHSVREGEGPGWCLCSTQRKMLSSESSYCPVGKEEYCFTSSRTPSITKETGNPSFCPLPSFSQPQAPWSTQKLPAGPWTPCYGGRQRRCIATSSCTISGPQEDTGPETGSCLASCPQLEGIWDDRGRRQQEGPATSATSS